MGMLAILAEEQKRRASARGLTINLNFPSDPLNDEENKAVPDKEERRAPHPYIS